MSSTGPVAVSSRAHGTRARYVVDRCRCPKCAEANRAYARYQQKRKRLEPVGRTSGPWAAPLVDAGPTVDHVRRLQAIGVGYKRVAQLAGVSKTALFKALSGRSRQVRRETASAVLALPLIADVAPHQLVDGLETTRLARLILHDTRWSAARLARELGTNRQRVDGILRGRSRVLRETERRVAELAYRLCVDLARESA